MFWLLEDSSQSPPFEERERFITDGNAMVADLPGHHHTTCTIRSGGATVVEIELNRSAPPLTIRPTFEELFRGGGNNGPGGVASWETNTTGFL